ncbi:membrane protein insertase YidC [Bacillus sp. Marseille-P3661]|uniref:membrane protein insertase YidC n=1 Tax=Bacillus sp. Marseille-P3661 TaxID=1936234 RepID=UPI0015E15E2C|nr:membrane protein insertase YidC [Bacillus sp. Marseille-P3661]
MKFFEHYFVQSFSHLLNFFAAFFHDNYGMSIIVLTILIRCVLLPITINQQKTQLQMKKMQPQLQEIKTKHSSKDPQEQLLLQQELMQLYKQNNFNPLNSGCLPLLVQMPILMGFFYAIRGTEEIATHSFLWFQLGTPDPLFILPFLAAFTTFIQTKALRRGEDSNPTNIKTLMYVMPIMILFFALKAPAALVLYWITGNLFYFLQLYIFSIGPFRKALSLKNEENA